MLEPYQVDTAEELDARVTELARRPYALDVGRYGALQCCGGLAVRFWCWACTTLCRTVGRSSCSCRRTRRVVAGRVGRCVAADCLPICRLRALAIQESLHPAHVERQMQYWRGKLAGLPPLLELPTDRPRPLVQRPEARVPIVIRAQLRAELEALAARQEDTLYMALLGAFQIQIARYSGQWDFALASPVATARTPISNASSACSSTRWSSVLTLTPSLSFVELLARVRTTVLDAVAHQDVLDDLVADLNPERSLSDCSSTRRCSTWSTWMAATCPYHACHSVN